MIKKIDIQNFGLFSDYNWDPEVGSDSAKDTFKKVNIIYGRNYSGKTTLSRIFRCVENGELHEDYEDSKFTISTDDGTIINQSNLSYSKKIRVYNTDFVKKNLSWLHDNKGEILPFALLGSGNQDIEENIENLEKEIKDIDIKLGTLNQETNSFEEDTLYFKHNIKITEVGNAKTNVSNLETDLTRKIKDKANNDIKKNPNYLNQKNSSSYNINSLSGDIEDIRSKNLDCSLSEEQEYLQKSIIKEDEKKSISSISFFNLDFISHIGYTKDLLIKEIKISKKISESIELDLLDWLKQGCKLHKNTDVCEFCHNPISTKRRDELEAFFNKESEELESNIIQEIKYLESLKIQTQDYFSSSNLTKDNFYVTLHSKFDIIKLKWDEAVKNQTKQIDLLKNSLSNRLKDLYTPIENVDFKNIETNTIDFNSIIEELNNLIIENNNKTATIEVEKDKARKVLRYNLIKTFLTDIDYEALQKGIEKAKREKENLNEELKQIEHIISNHLNEKAKCQKRIEELKNKLDDQSLAAEKINEHLRNFFGHDSIQLKPSEQQIDDDVKTRFVVKRGDQEAKNLSEGECSLVAFCYFMAKIANELQDPEAKDKLIIYIDDPISSLDSNHIFFMYSLIESITLGVSQVNPKFCQLFISTHNLEFLKHLSNLHKYKNTEQKYRQNFIIDKRKKDTDLRSYLKKMPRYLRINISEYLYLFDEIYKMANIETVTNDKIQYFEDNYTQLYAMGNIMRKFLECYICTKYPHIDSPFQNLSILFPNSIPLQINRIVQEYSHLQWGARASLPIDVPEAEETAKKIIEALKAHDSEHYDSLVNCINNIENA